MTAIKGGYTNYGQDIGILMMRTVFPAWWVILATQGRFPCPCGIRLWTWTPST